jgi:putative CocE/NonD family hydrolase
VSTDVLFEFDARVPLRDGTELSADIYRPRAAGRFAVILTRTPYDNASPAVVRTAEYFARRGYVFVAADVRGRGDSDGRFTPFRGEGPDGADTVAWITSQPWSNGRVGMMGGSYASSVQWLAARERPEGLVTIVSTATSGRQVQDPVVRGKLRPSLFMWLQATGGRTMQLTSVDDGGPSIAWADVLRHRPFREADQALGRLGTAWPEWMCHRDDDAYWATESQFVGVDAIDLPVLHITGWYDGSITGELEMYQLLAANEAARRNQYLVIGPWDHAGTRVPERILGMRDFGPDSVLDVLGLHRRWFDHWLRDEPSWPADEPRVRTFTMGANEWRDRDAWPLRTTPLTWYLRTLNGVGRLDPTAPTGDESRSYAYDPEDPTPSAPDAGGIRWGAGVLDHHDHSFVEARDDVLVYTSEPLAAPLTITGAPVAELTMSTTAADTDAAVVLSEVTATGASIIVAEGLVRLSYRTPGSRRALLAPGEMVSFSVSLNATSITVPAGHCLRLTVSSALFPAYDRNPNTGAAPGDDEQWTVARQTVYQASARASRLVLPVEASSDQTV